jgi:thiosulfate dehydrogenase [quinone] large subunit
MSAQRSVRRPRAVILGTARVVLGAARVALGILWVGEAIVKLRAGFGAADIALVVDAASRGTRIPEGFRLFAEGVMGPLAPLFGATVPLWELALGVLLIAGVATLPAAALSSFTLVLYWSSDQLTAVYPLMAVLGVGILLWPSTARRYGVSRLLSTRMPRRGARALVGGRWA